MATNTFKENKETSKKTANKIFSKIRYISGLILKGFSAYLTIALISHLFHLKNDQSIVETVVYHGFKKADLHGISNKLGIIGAIFSYFLYFRWLGIASFLVPPIIYMAGHRLIFPDTKLKLFKYFNIIFFFLLWITIAISYMKISFDSTTLLDNLIGGVGYDVTSLLKSYVGWGIAIGLIVSILPFLIPFIKIKNFQLPKFFKRNKPIPQQQEDPPASSEILLNLDDQPKEKEEPKAPDETTNNLTLTIEDTNTEEDTQDIAPEHPVGEKSSPLEKKLEDYDPTLDLSNYKYPTPELLIQHSSGKVKVATEELEQNKNKIVETLINFKIGISSIKATIGPTVTLYEIVPEAGIKISKIKNLEDDIALNLAALGIRIIAPIPGKGTIGIEVPNKNREVVPFKSIVQSEKFTSGRMELPIIIGKTISNEIHIADLTKMPHLLIAGATGQGKSVGLNVILSSLLYKKHPSQLKLVLVDPKKVELSLYSKTERHFLAKLPSSGEPIITATKEVIHTLNSLCIEMDTRYELLKDAGARNIKEYNTKFVNRRLNPKQGHRFLPYIVLVIDEFADMMMTAGKEIETPVARLAQLARAIGIHLVLATQRPSVNVITGIIKANFPARLSYKVSSKIDSRTILDSGGAEQLVGQGDLLMSLNSDVIRLQCPFIDTQEVEDVCEYIGSQQGYQSAYQLPEYQDEKDLTGNEKEIGERDSMFEEAARLVVNHQQGSTSLIQRRLKLGYNRAGRIIDQLEAAGIVGPFEGSKSRAVLVPDESSLELFFNEEETNTQP